MNKIHWRNRFLPEQKSVCGCGEVQLFILIYVCLHFIVWYTFYTECFPSSEQELFYTLFSDTVISVLFFFGFISYLYVSDKRLLIQPTKIPLQKKPILNHQQLIQGDFQNKYQNKN